MENKSQLTGYLHPLYAQSLAEFGTPRHLPRSSGWILERPIPGSRYRDAMGCYPLFACRDWQHLSADLETLATETDLICLSLVTDPFGNYSDDDLRQIFSDHILPFKQHFIVDPHKPIETIVSSHHQRNAHKALQAVQVEVYPQPDDLLDDWLNLYRTLIKRHHIQGISAFSKSAFATQLRIPGLVAFRAVHRTQTVGMMLWYVQGDVAYYHLGAYSNLGYQLRASFALFWQALDYFSTSKTIRWLNLGAGAGLNSQADDGLTRFKRGWATGTRTAYFCGKIFDHAKYAEIVQMKNIPPTNYFPAYRQGEF